ncbi:MAG: hypothetical protein PHQ89_03480 [Bacilli bacterium]|nr:hypothetical protein [Bacilli bacterium]
MKIRKIILCFIVLFICGCSANSDYTRSNKSGKIINISLAQMKEKMENKDTFAIAFTTSYCNYCLQFHNIFDEYMKTHEVTLYQVVLDEETTNEMENIEIIHTYFPEFNTTPGIFYVEDGKEENYLNTYASGISEEIIDEWVIKYKMDEKN